MQVLSGAAGYRHFGADDIDRRLAARFFPGTLGNRAQPCCAFSCHCLRDRLRIVRARHGAVEMDLPESRGDVLPDQHLRLLHCRRCRLLAPRIGAEMIPTQPEAFRGKIYAPRDPLNEAPEIIRRHAGVAAELIHLVGRGFDQQRRSGRSGLLQRAIDHRGVSRAEGIDPRLLPALVTRQHFEQLFHPTGTRADSSGCNANSSAANGVRAIAAIFMGPCVTPKTFSIRHDLHLWMTGTAILWDAIRNHKKLSFVLDLEVVSAVVPPCYFRLF